MADYFETPAILGETPFLCYVCGKRMTVDIEGEYTVKLKCTRCKTKAIAKHVDGETSVTLVTEKALPDTLVVKHGELVHL